MSFRDRDFVSTEEGFLFCVVGPYHPVDRVISYLKYLPSVEGRWKRGDTRFERVMRSYTIPSLLETFAFLENDFPQYRFFSKIYDINMTAVPHRNITRHFQPEKKLSELFRRSHLDSLQKKILHIVSLLSELSEVPITDFGITGSVLLEIHNPVFSDMDITVYGTQNSFSVKKTLSSLFMSENLNVEHIEKVKFKVWLKNKIRNHPVSFVEARKIYDHKWNIGVFKGTLFSVHPVKVENELEEKYGDLSFRQGGIVNLRATVSDSGDSIFLPAVYKVSEVEIEEDISANIKEVVCYEGLYDSLAEKSETIIVRGKLEHVSDSRTGKKYDRVLVGSLQGKGKEYIKPAV